MSKCLVYQTYCEEHGFTHGAEAEELRKGIEELIEQYSIDPHIVSSLRGLLDRVDARDSLAYLEARDVSSSRRER